MLHLMSLKVRADPGRKLLTSFDWRQHHMLVLMSMVAARDETLSLMEIHALERISLRRRSLQRSGARGERHTAPVG